MEVFSWKEGASPPLIGAHSRTKLTIYGEYIRSYILERVQFGMERFRINIVDGFCGGGLFRTGKGLFVPGSPITILEAIADAEREINSSRDKPIWVEYRLYCYDQDAEAIEYLRSRLIEEGYGSQIGTAIFLERANFSQIAHRLVPTLAAQTGKTIFILDQLGYGAVSFDTLRRIFSTLDRPEVILTFAYEWLTSFVGQYAEICRRFRDLSIIPPPEAAYLRAVGGRYGVQRFIQTHLIQEFRQVAPFFTPFFLTSRTEGAVRGSNLKYWLVHLAAHERANDVMKRVHWGVSNHSAHFLGAGLEMLGFDPDKGSEVTPYLFGEVDQFSTRQALLQDIPRFIADRERWTTVGKLWEESCNETPSTSQMQGSAIAELAASGELEVTGGGGGEKRGGAVTRTDLVRLPLQKSFFFMLPDRSASARPA